MLIKLDDDNNREFNKWWDASFEGSDSYHIPCADTRCNTCDTRKNLWISDLLDNQVTEYVAVPEIPADAIILNPKDAIIINNILSTTQMMIMGMADDGKTMTPEWLVAYLAVRGVAPIQERLYNQVKNIDTDALIKTGD